MIASEPAIIREQLRRGAFYAERAYPADAEPAGAVAIVPPHPHMGGTMNNNLVAALAAALATTRITLRFDYSAVVGTPASLAAFWATGHAPEDPSLIDDASAAIGQLRDLAGVEPAVVGYSFGAFAAWRLDLDGPLALVSPTLTRHEFAGRRSPLLVVYSDDDFATPREVSEQFCKVHGCEAQLVSGGQHFYRGHEATVADRLERFLAGGEA